MEFKFSQSQPFDVSEFLKQKMQEPGSASVEGRSVVSRDLSDILEALKYMEQRQAAQDPLAGIRIYKISRPGLNE